MVLTEILVAEIERIPHLLLNRRGDADATGVGQRLQPGRYVHARPEQAVVLNTDLPQVNNSYVEQ